MLLESDFPPDIRVENEIESLLKHGDEVHILCYNHKKSKPLYEIVNGLHIHRFNIPKITHKSSVGCLKVNLYFNYWYKMVERVDKNFGPFGFIHVHDLQLAKVGYQFKQNKGAKFILDLHENWPSLLNLSAHTKTFLGKILFSLKQWERYENKYTQLADRVIVVVEEAKKRLFSLGVKEDNIVVLTNALNLKCFDSIQGAPQSNKTVFVYGGGINYHRGLQNIISAIPLIKSQKQFEVWIIGDGSYLPELKNLAHKINAEEKICFFGWQTQTELLKLVSQSNIALIPHLKSEHTDSTIPHKLFQYMYAGIPILSSNCEPLERIIKETDSGLIFDGENLNDIAEKMSLFLSDTSLAEKKAQSKHWVEEKYNWQEAEKELLKCYQSMETKPQGSIE